MSMNPLMSPASVSWLALRTRFAGRPVFNLILLAAILPTGLSKAQTNSLLDHFSWGVTPSIVQVGQPFPSSIQARDATNSLLTNFNGTVLLSELVPGGSPTVLLTEIETINTERVELSNVSTNPVDL